MHYNLSNLRLHYFLACSATPVTTASRATSSVQGLRRYAWNLGSGFGIDVQAGADITWTHYRKYYCVHCGQPMARQNKVYLLPKVAVDIIYKF